MGLHHCYKYAKLQNCVVKNTHLRHVYQLSTMVDVWKYGTKYKFHIKGVNKGCFHLPQSKFSLALGHG